MNHDLHNFGSVQNKFILIVVFKSFSSLCWMVYLNDTFYSYWGAVLFKYFGSFTKCCHIERILVF
jgi:hypothetical protein